MYIAMSGCQGYPGIYQDITDPENPLWYGVCTGCGSRATSDPDRDTAIQNWNDEQPCANEPMA